MKHALTKHHRKCKSRGGKNHPSNISMVDEKKHASWHNLFSNMSPYEIALAINKTWIDPEYWFVVAKKG